MTDKPCTDTNDDQEELLCPLPKQKLTRSGTNLEIAKVQAIELLATGSMTQQKVAEIVGTTPQTICKWRKDPVFMESVVEQSRQILKQNLPGVYKKLTEKSIEGHDRHIKIYLDHLEKLEEAKASQVKIEFTWKAASPLSINE